jgi:hypothetical protein
VEAQHQVYTSFAYGTYLHNSENDLRVMKEADYSSLIGFDLGYAYRFSDSHSLSIEFTYLTSNADHVMRFVETSPLGPQTVDYIYGDAQLLEYIVDVSISQHITEWLEAKLGPSGAILNRVFKVDQRGLEDRLSSRAFGLHGGLEVAVPFTEDGGLKIVAAATEIPPFYLI